MYKNIFRELPEHPKFGYRDGPLCMKIWYVSAMYDIQLNKAILNTFLYLYLNLSIYIHIPIYMNDAQLFKKVDTCNIDHNIQNSIKQYKGNQDTIH